MSGWQKIVPGDGEPPRHSVCLPQLDTPDCVTLVSTERERHLNGLRYPIRILYFISRLDLAGTEIQAVELARRLDPAKFSFYFASIFQKGPLLEEILRLARSHQHVRLTSFFNPSFPLSVARLARFLQHQQIDILHSFDFYSNLVGTLAGRLARVPLVLASRRHLGKFLTTRQLWAERWAFHLAHRVLANCQSVAHSLIDTQRVRSEKIRVIYNGINLSPYDADKMQQGREVLPLVGMLANVRPAKDHGCFLRAAAKVARQFPSARFVLVGSRSQDVAVRSLCERLGIADRVDLLGVQPHEQIPGILGSFAVSVLASHGEGLPNAVLESMAAGRPVVATAVGGCRELIDDRYTGFLVPAGDANQLAEKILFLLQNPGQAATMGRRGREKVARLCDFKIVAEEWENFYRDELMRLRLNASGARCR